MTRMIIAALALVAWAVQAVAGADEDAIAHLMRSSFDKPETRLVVDPIAIAGDHAIAGWTQGEMGGRALLRSRHGKWTLILCAGDGIKSAEALRQAGMKPAAAEQLATRLAESERQTSPDRLAMFAKFEGIVMMDAAGHHPPVNQHKH